MATTQEKQQRLEALESAIDSGASSITIDGNTVKYNSLYDMERAKRKLEAQLCDGGTRRRPVISSLGRTLRGQ